MPIRGLSIGRPLQWLDQQLVGDDDVDVELLQDADDELGIEFLD